MYSPGPNPAQLWMNENDLLARFKRKAYAAAHVDEHRAMAKKRKRAQEGGKSRSALKIVSANEAHARGNGGGGLKHGSEDEESSSILDTDDEVPGLEGLRRRLRHRKNATATNAGETFANSDEDEHSHGSEVRSNSSWEAQSDSDSEDAACGCSCGCAQPRAKRAKVDEAPTSAYVVESAAADWNRESAPVRPTAADLRTWSSAGDTVSFKDLPAYYASGTEVFFQDSMTGRLAGGVVESSEVFHGEKTSKIYIWIECIVSNGVAFTETTVTARVPEFSGDVPHSDLPVNRFYSEVKDLKSKFSLRGSKYASMSLGVKHLDYSGLLHVRTWFGINKVPATGRIVVDLRGAHRYAYGALGNPYEGVSVESTLGSLSLAQTENSPEAYYIAAQKKSQPPISLDANGAPIADLWRIWPTLPAYSLAAKQWGIVTVDSLDFIEYRTAALDELNIPVERKEIMETLITYRKKNKGEFDDIVAGKAGGLIMLLHGPPGVGKTLTAEAVADRLQVPLYSISVGELGTTPDSLEYRLERALELAASWDAVVLLDEADIFMEKRNTIDVKRNALVGVFLRKLEYFSGVLFLTTNRVSEIDAAFDSRISLSIRYEKLDKEAKQRIWKHFLQKIAADMEKVDLAKLALIDLDARQIKGVARMAQAVADKLGVAANQDVLYTVLKLKGL